MYGPVPSPPPHRPPGRGTVLTLRVAFVAATVLSLGFLSWAAMLRAAIVLRRPLGWWLFAADLALFVGTCVLIVSFPETDWRTNVGVGLLLLQIAAVVAYYLAVDLRAERTHAMGPVPAAYPVGAFPVGAFPPPYAPPAPGHPHPPLHPSLHVQETQPFPSYATTGTVQPPMPPPAAPQVPEHRPAPPQRIDQVRAELDELSDYLRKEGR
ncbi:hypothetical protein [Streptomyces noursei]|uniref:hypothetical protein n=1 Tax=Streptomyces noursei TaxID=1971 RepID=UPI0038119526